jgi:hypothetical protein
MHLINHHTSPVLRTDGALRTYELIKWRCTPSESDTGSATADALAPSRVGLKGEANGQ